MRSGEAGALMRGGGAPVAGSDWGVDEIRSGRCSDERDGVPVV